jgi:2',3'-cyclic-nucleotide 2'-phosphodiesterase (5'-nucleotidase family)
LVVAMVVCACTVKQDQPDLTGQDIRLTFIHTADIHSRLFPYNFTPNTFDQGYGLTKPPYGGIARIATITKQIRASANRSLWLDSGDAFQGAPVFNEFHGEAEMRALSLAGMDGAVLGNHEFDLGAKNLFDKIDNWATFPILAANYAWDTPPPSVISADGRSLRDIIPPYAIYDVKGLRIGVIGMGNTSTITSIYEAGNNLGFRPIADSAALDAWVRVLRPQVDLIVVLSHLGLDEDEGLQPSQVESDPNQNFNKQTLSNVDLILGGHLHIVTNPPKIIPNDDLGHNTILVHSGAFAKFVGRLDVVVHVGTDNNDPANRSRITSFSYINLPVQNDTPDDAQVASLMWPYSVKINQDIDLNGVFAYINSRSAPGKPGQEKILRTDTGGGDSQLGNLVARSMQIQQEVQAEFAITNSLGIRADFEYGPLTIEQMYNVFPFENSITVIYLSGEEVQETFDYVAVRSAERGCRTQAQVAGIAFDMVCAGPNGPHAANIAIGDHCRTNDDPNAEIDFNKCAPLNPISLYRVAVNDYIAAGGSGFDVLRRNTSKQDTGIALRDSLRVYLNQLRFDTSANSACGDQTADFNDLTTAACTKDDDCAGGQLCTNNACAYAKVTSYYGDVSCLGPDIEKHDGRIRPTFE